MPPTDDDPLDWFMPLEIKGNFDGVTLDEYFKNIAARLKGDLEYLRGPITPWRNWSFSLRILAFILLALAVILPLPLFEPIKNGPNGVELAYVSALFGRPDHVC